MRPVPVYRIHPAIGIARLGNSPDEFCISPETPAALPLACDGQGNPSVSADGVTPLRVSKFKDAEGRIRRQAARFRIFVYDEKSPEGRPLAIGDAIEGGGNHGTLVNIQWRVHLANKKACWFEFRQLEGEHGYSSDHDLRNSSIKDQNERQRLIIDPGPQAVDLIEKRRARFDRGTGDLYAAVFPPEDLKPQRIDTLGEILTDDSGRLLVLGGRGHSGTFLDSFGQPRIDDYANNDGWFDDTSDGPVTARLIMQSAEVGRTRYIDVEYPAWVIAAYPAYVPQVLDIVTLDDVMYNTAVTKFACRTDIFGKAGTFGEPERVDASDFEALALWLSSALMWNPDYKPWFYRDIWPILFRADEYTYLTNVLGQSNYPHNQTERGNFDPDKLSLPPRLNAAAYARVSRESIEANNSGRLFFEALDSELSALDHQSATSSQISQPYHFAAVAQKVGARERLEQSLRDFAAVTSGATAPVHPDEFLGLWEAQYARAQRSEETDNQAYREVSERVRAALQAYEKELGQAHEGESHAKAKHSRAALSPSQQPATMGQKIATIFERVSGAYRSGRVLKEALERARRQCIYDPFAPNRRYLYDLLRKDGEENIFHLEHRPTSRVHHLPLMPLLNGDNPLSNTLPSKFLRLTEVQLYLLGQWADGKFFNEILEGWVPKKDVDPWQPFANLQSTCGYELDRHVLTNLAGGAFCPGAEVGWIIRNPSIYVEPYRIKADPLFSSFTQTAANENKSAGGVPIPEQDYIAYVETPLSQSSDYEVGLQPGDLTKMMALPWQADFNECSTENVDVTYDLWIEINPDSENDPWLKREDKVWRTLWWPAHRPMQVFELVEGTESQPRFQFLNWAHGIPQTPAGDLKMVTEWSRLGFVIRNPYAAASDLDKPSPDPPPPKYINVERNRNREGEQSAQESS